MHAINWLPVPHKITVNAGPKLKNKSIVYCFQLAVELVARLKWVSSSKSSI